MKPLGLTLESGGRRDNVLGGGSPRPLSHGSKHTSGRKRASGPAHSRTSRRFAAAFALVAFTLKQGFA